MTSATRSAVLLRAAVPTIRATPWAPVAVLIGSLLVLSVLLRLRDTTSDAALLLGAAAVASALVHALRDPADALLAAVPVGRLTRRLLRLALVTAVAVPLWLVLTLVMPGAGTGLAPLVALVSCGLAVATWLPADIGALPAAALPLVWAVANQLLGAWDGVVGDLAGLWATDPWPVSGVALVLVALGRHR